jgi:hypothetical protein
MQLTQLIYVSHLVDDNESTLAAILESAVRNNRQNGITGMLLYADGSLIQVLEGDESAVQTTYDRICQDRRHSQVTCLQVEPVAERHFAHWSMGYKRLRAEDLEKLPKLAPHFRFGTGAKAFNVRPGDALDMLLLFSKR